MKLRRGWIAIERWDHEGAAVEEGTRVYFTRTAAQRAADRITVAKRRRGCEGEVVELWVPR